MTTDTSTPTPAPPAAAPARSRARRLARRAFFGLLALVALLGAAYLALGTQAALDFVVRRAIDQSEGRLAIENAEGSLLSTVRVARIAWRGDDMDVEAREIALSWSPLDLVSRRFIVHGLGAHYLEFHFKGSGGGGGGLPASLALPLEVEVRHIGVQRIEWRSGEGGGFVTGVAFGYRGGAVSHAVRGLRFVTVDGTLEGDAELAATAPFALRGTLGFTGDAAFRDARATLAVDGTLERIGVSAQGNWRNADVKAKALLTPFAKAILVSADIDAHNVDVAQFLSTLPATDLTLTLAARPDGDGFAGTLSARNDAAGTLDSGRVPVAALASRFAWDGRVLALSDVDAQVANGGRATGRVNVPIDGGAIEASLKLVDVDLSRIQSTLLATQLSGTLDTEVTPEKQVVHANLRQSDVALVFAATIAERRLTLTQARVQAGGGVFEGSGTLELSGTRAFSLSARASGFDPARFAAVPEAALNGTVTARGTLGPPWLVTADVALGRGSQLAGLAAEGTARAQITSTTAKNIGMNLKLGASTLTLSGAIGTSADTLAFNVDIRNAAELRPLLARYSGIAVPEKLAGALRARGSVEGDWRSPGLTVDVHARQLLWGAKLGAATLDVSAKAARGIGADGTIALDARPLTLSLAATELVLPGAELATLRATANGTLARHQVTIAATSADFDLTAGFAGGIVHAKHADGSSDVGWKGSVESLANRGAYAFRLESPATLAYGADRFEIGAARMSVADGRAELRNLVVDDGRVSTQGSFTGIPVASIARLAGTPLPFASTLELGGEWSLAATPRLNGTVEIRRERGDLYTSDSATLQPSDLALGISELQLSARFAEDAMTASARFRSLRAGTADATATLDAGSVPGRVATDAPLAATLIANLASLRPLQPWLGTLAVLDGRAHVALAARGTLAEPRFSGTMEGDALRFDLPRHGVHLKDGRLRARLADRSLLLDEFSFVGGKGRFNAKGTLAHAAGTAPPGERAAARIEWEAEDFTLVNRPDLRLVADGKGTLAFDGGKVVLIGSIDMDEGLVVFARTSVGTLSEDVVIVGQPRRNTDSAMRDLPLSLDIEVALGRDFRFTGEGLDTRLAGRVRVTTNANGALSGKGTIRAASGTYYVFGQRLDIDRGRLIFDGPLDNPALDVVALRKNLAVEAGVEVSGTVHVPRVRLVSNPPVPDGEKLSWLLTGQGLDRAGRADIAMLSAASASLLGQGQRPITTRIANVVGLDDISVHESASGVAGATSGQVISFGKRISDRLSLVYEQGLTVATNALRIEYMLARSWTLRAEAGIVSSVGVFFRRNLK
ncbi:MAG: translocation/assembly module TamB domain-containing protein [Burkholderiales bacterium]|nr:translocation/assembly module TamB domain-containing protein [Burkholderiales bacterium]